MSDFIIIMAPSLARELSKPETPRERWKRERHEERYERRFGSPPAIIEGHLGVFEGMVFHG